MRNTTITDTDEFVKEIKAIIRPSKLLEVTEELHEIKGFGKSRDQHTEDKVVYEMVEFLPRIQLEVVVDDIVKIRTNERGKDAI